MAHDPQTTNFGTIPSASGGITRLAYARVAAEGTGRDLLKKAGLTPQQIADPSARLKAQDQVTFLNIAAAALHDDWLGFHLAQEVDLREMGFLYYVSASASFLGDALQRMARYSSIANESVSLKYLGGDAVVIAFGYLGVGRYLDQHQIEFFVTALVRMCRQLTKLRVMPIRVRFTHRRVGEYSEFSEFLGADVEFGADVDEVTFAITVKDLSIVSADPYLNQLLVKYCEDALSRRKTTSSSFRSRVENTIVPLLPHGKARANEIARRLGVSQRTFARRLSSEGLTYSDALEGLRYNLAERYLMDRNLSISQIAWLLGYQEVSAFTHAFKRWTGKTPRQVRSERT